MLDLKFITDNAETVETALNKRSGSYDVKRVVTLDEKRKAIIREVELLKANRNSVSTKIAELKKQKLNADDLILQMKEESDKIKQLDEQLAIVINDINSALLSIPNMPQEDVPVGKSDEDNKVIRSYLEPTKFDFVPKPHWETGEALNILDAPTAAKITGARFTVYKGLGARLERAIINLMLDTHTSRGYTEIFTPFLANKDSMTGTGQLPKFEEDMFAITNTDFYLIPTAEVTVTNLFRDNIINLDTSINYCAYSACFRAEAGSAGRDTRGLIRQHQFNKVELVKFCAPEQSAEEHEKLTADAEFILKTLKLPYRTSMLCTGDLGFSSSKTYDLEVWMPSYGRYVEISSCSNFLSYQARRANIKYRDSQGKLQFAHTLNGSGLAVGRTVAAILENYQNEDGSVTVPEALVKYMCTDIIK